MTDENHVSSEEARDIGIAVHVFWMLVCTGIGIGIWGFIVDRMRGLFDTGCPYLVGAGFVLAINAGHYAWELFTPDEDLTDFAPDKGPLMLTNWEIGRAWIRIVSLLTVAPSMYLRRIIAMLRSGKPEE